MKIVAVHKKTGSKYVFFKKFNKAALVSTKAAWPDKWTVDLKNVKVK